MAPINGEANSAATTCSRPGAQVAKNLHCSDFEETLSVYKWLWDLRTFEGTSRVFGWAEAGTGAEAIWDFIGELLWVWVVEERKFLGELRSGSEIDGAEREKNGGLS